MHIFIKAIPYNFYALFTIVMMLILVKGKISYGPMRAFEKSAESDSYWENKLVVDEKAEEKKKGKVIDMIIPIILLIGCCTVGMIYTGGFFKGESFIDAFANSDASIGLVLGSSVALMITIVFYLIRRVITFEECMNCLPEGFKQMVPAILILTFAWSLKAMTDALGAAPYVAGVVNDSAICVIKSFLPTT